MHIALHRVQSSCSLEAVEPCCLPARQYDVPRRTSHNTDASPRCNTNSLLPRTTCNNGDFSAPLATVTILISVRSSHTAGKFSPQFKCFLARVWTCSLVFHVSRWRPTIEQPRQTTLYYQWRLSTGVRVAERSVTFRFCDGKRKWKVWWSW